MSNTASLVQNIESFNEQMNTHDSNGEQGVIVNVTIIDVDSSNVHTLLDLIEDSYSIDTYSYEIETNTLRVKVWN